MPMILYMTPLSSPVRAVLMTAEALGIKLECREMDLLIKKEHKTPEFLKMNPQHTIPVLDDNGTILWDSHAIISYLARKYGKNDALYPEDYAKRAVVDQRMYFENSVAFIALRTIVLKFYFKNLKSISEEDRNAVIETYEFLETFLTGRKWVAGEFLSIADFSLLATITSLDILIKIDEKKFPNIIRWIHQGEQQNWYKVNVPGLNAHREFLNNYIS